MRKSVKRILVTGALLILALELVSRFILGLGTPPLSIAHPRIEYMFRPNQNVMRFGNQLVFNEFGMRSISLAEIAAKHRILVFGDSVVNGGNLTDQADLATTLLSDSNTFYGNVSAGSWGPANMAAWLEEFGSQKADTAVVVLSSHDAYDLPTFAPLDPENNPTKAPILALEEAIFRYLPRYLPFAKVDARIAKAETPDLQTQQAGHQAIERLLSDLHKSGMKVCLIQHLTIGEMNTSPAYGWNEIRFHFKNRGYPVVQLSDWTRPALAKYESPFRDDIHLNAAGQKLLMQAISKCVLQAKHV